MASKNLMVSTHNCLSKFQRLMFSSVAQKNNIVQKPSVKHDGPFSRGNEGSNNNVKYCTVLTMLTTFSLFLYSCKKKFNFEYSLFPTVFAISRNDNSLRSRFNFVADVVEQCENAVVCIESLVSRLGVQNVIPRGSGFIVKEDGLIITNAHVVINKPRSFQVKLKDGRTYPGQIEDVDVKADLATIRIKEKNLPVMKLGSSEDLRAGEWVIAIGNPFSLKNSVSAGVVSAPQRKGEDLGLDYKHVHYIQTDASITFGHSGGPLVNLDGEVVGVNSMKVESGISFAIPIEAVKGFLETKEMLRKSDRVVDVDASLRKRGYMGVVLITLTPDIFHELTHKQYRLPDFLINKVLICEISLDSPAYRCGLQPGDIIAEINGRDVDGMRCVYEALETESILRLKIFRQNTFFYVNVPVEQL